LATGACTKAATIRRTANVKLNPLLESTMSYPTISSSKVEGTNVYNLQGDKLGSIDDLVIDKRSGQVRYAALEAPTATRCRGTC